MSTIEIKRCKRCILDTTVTDIWFDDKGECKYCKIHDEMEKIHPLGSRGDKKLYQIIDKIKTDGIGKEYDCIVGVSGGRDSSYTLLKAVEYGLRPLAVHFDCGWNSNISVQNIQNAITKLDVDLHTHVADWEEFKELQISFLMASTPDADVPTDYAIYSVLYDTANKEGIKYILNGHSFRTEGTSPISWTYMDGRYVKSVFRKFSQKKKINSFPIMSMIRLIYLVIVKGIREIRLMEYIDYKKEEVGIELEKKLNWQYYGGHHHENLYTKFFQSFLLPKKFNIDKRKTELSALVRTKQINRNEAINIIQESNYKFEDEVVDYTISKLGLSREEFNKLFNAPIKSFNDYATYRPLIKLLKFPIKIACSLRILPLIFYLKYVK